MISQGLYTSCQCHDGAKAKKTMIHELGRLNSGITGAQAGWGGVGYRVKNLSPPQRLKKIKSCWIFIDSCLPSFCVADISLKASVERRGYWKWYFFYKKCPKSFQKWDKYPISPSLNHTNSYLQVALLFLRLSLEPLFSPVSFFLLLLFLLVSLNIFCDLGVVDSSCLAECFGDTSLSLNTQLNFIQKWENKAVTRQ